MCVSDILEQVTDKELKDKIHTNISFKNKSINKMVNQYHKVNKHHLYRAIISESVKICLYKL